MIRPSVAPIRQKVIQEPQFEKIQLHVESDSLVINTPISSQRNKHPYTPRLPPLQHSPSPKESSPRRTSSPLLQETIPQLVQNYLLQKILPLLNQHTLSLSHLRDQLQQLKLGLNSSLKKQKLQINEIHRLAMSDLVFSFNQVKRINSESVERMEERVGVVERVFERTERQHAEAIEKAYLQIKEVGNFVVVLTERLETLERNEAVGDPALQEMRVGDLSEIKERIGSKLSAYSLQPDSIASGYQQSEARTDPPSSIRAPHSFIRKLDNVEEADSEMIILNEVGDVTDTKGKPILDKLGNLVVFDLKQIREELKRGGTPKVDQ